MPAAHICRLLAPSILCAAFVAGLTAQSPSQLTLRTEWRVEGDAKGLSKIGDISVGPSGTVAASLPQDQSVRLFSVLGRALQTIGPNGLEMPEFQSVNRMGWKGDTLWVFDMQLRRTSMVTPAGKLLRRIPLAYESKRTATADRYFLGAIPVKFLAGDAFIASGFLADRTLKHFAPSLFQANLALTQFAEVAPLPSSKCEAVRASTGPGCRIGLSAFSPNGEWIATSEVPVNDPAGRTFELRLMSSHGQKAFAKAVAPPTVKPRWSALPPFLQVGSDGTVWVGGADAEGVRWLAFDAKGTALGTVVIPRNYRVAAVSRTRIWVIETDAKGVESILQLGVGAK